MASCCCSIACRTYQMHYSAYASCVSSSAADASLCRHPDAPLCLALHYIDSYASLCETVVNSNLIKSFAAQPPFLPLQHTVGAYPSLPRLHPASLSSECKFCGVVTNELPGKRWLQVLTQANCRMELRTSNPRAHTPPLDHPCPTCTLPSCPGAQ